MATRVRAGTCALLIMLALVQAGPGRLDRDLAERIKKAPPAANRAPAARTPEPLDQMDEVVPEDVQDPVQKPSEEAATEAWKDLLKESDGSMPNVNIGAMNIWGSKLPGAAEATTEAADAMPATHVAETDASRSGDRVAADASDAFEGYGDYWKNWWRHGGKDYLKAAGAMAQTDASRSGDRVAADASDAFEGYGDYWKNWWRHGGKDYLKAAGAMAQTDASRSGDRVAADASDAFEGYGDYWKNWWRHGGKDYLKRWWRNMQT